MNINNFIMGLVIMFVCLGIMLAIPGITTLGTDTKEMLQYGVMLLGVSAPLIGLVS